MVRRRVQPQGCREVLLLLQVLLVRELWVVGRKLILDQVLGELKVKIPHQARQKLSMQNANELSFAAPVPVIYFGTELPNFGAFGHSVNPSNEPDKLKTFGPPTKCGARKGKENSKTTSRKTGDES